MKTAYICDGRAPCAGRFGCCFAKKVIPNPCTHTTNTLYAVNGACAHPENHPERFVIVGDDIAPYIDEHGITFMGLFHFLIKWNVPNSI